MMMAINRQHEIYEYAGFKFQIVNRGDRLEMVPLPNQHHAAYRERHSRAALAEYLSAHAIPIVRLGPHPDVPEHAIPSRARQR
jgi:hypothetical protein